VLQTHKPELLSHLWRLNENHSQTGLSPGNSFPSVSNSKKILAKAYEAESVTDTTPKMAWYQL